MAGFWHLSHHQMRSPNGAVYAGARATFYAADSLLPITVYQDYGLGTAHPNPVEANAYGVFPPVFFDEEDGFYRQRITTTDGVIIPGTDVGTLPIIGPSEGGGGSEVPVDPNALFQTGDVIWLDVTGTRAGWVRDNGRTIGSATSGASERANADTQALFTFLWQTFSDTICPVTGGRGGSSAADYAANKPIGLPDKRGYIVGGLDDMGNSAAGRYANVPVIAGSVTAAGSIIGETLNTLTTTQMPTHGHTVSITDHPVTRVQELNNAAARYTASGLSSGATNAAVRTITDGASDLVIPVLAHTASIGDAGSGGAHNNVQKTVLGTIYRKL